MSDATAARRAMAVLRALAAAPGPLPAAALARQLGIPRSSAYHLLAAMAEDGFVQHYPEDRRWGLGVSAFELGSAYARHDPLARLAQPILRQLVRRLPPDLAAACHCAVLHGRETVYIATAHTPRSVSVIADVGVRVPASLTASGRSMLAMLPPAQVRALFPDAGVFVDRTGTGPMTPSALTRLLAAERRSGFSVEEGMVVPGFASLAASSVDRSGRPAASVGVTVHAEAFEHRLADSLARVVQRAAAELSRHISGLPAA